MTEKAKLLKRVTSDPAICDGMVCFKGTRTPIAVVLDSLAAGLSAEEVLKHYPHLKAVDIRAAIAYAADLARESVWKLSA